MSFVVNASISVCDSFSGGFLHGFLPVIGIVLILSMCCIWIMDRSVENGSGIIPFLDMLSKCTGECSLILLAIIVRKTLSALRIVMAPSCAIFLFISPSAFWNSSSSSREGRGLLMLKYCWISLLSDDTDGMAGGSCSLHSCGGEREAAYLWSSFSCLWFFYILTEDFQNL